MSNSQVKCPHDVQLDMTVRISAPEDDVVGGHQPGPQLQQLGGGMLGGEALSAEEGYGFGFDDCPDSFEV